MLHVSRELHCRARRSFGNQRQLVVSRVISMDLLEGSTLQIVLLILGQFRDSLGSSEVQAKGVACLPGPGPGDAEWYPFADAESSELKYFLVQAPVSSNCDDVVISDMCMLGGLLLDQRPSVVHVVSQDEVLVGGSGGLLARVDFLQATITNWSVNVQHINKDKDPHHEDDCIVTCIDMSEQSGCAPGVVVSADNKGTVCLWRAPSTNLAPCETESHIISKITIDVHVVSLNIYPRGRDILVAGRNKLLL